MWATQVVSTGIDGPRAINLPYQTRTGRPAYAGHDTKFWFGLISENQNFTPCASHRNFIKGLAATKVTATSSTIFDEPATFTLDSFIAKKLFLLISSISGWFGS